MKTDSLSVIIDSPANRGPQGLAWVRRMARYGYFAKGLIYCLIGIIAGMASLGKMPSPTDGQGALRAVLNQPMGEFLLLWMAATLGCYCLWRLIQALGPASWSGARISLGKRIHRFYSAVIHGLIAGGAARIYVMRAPGESQEKTWREAASFFFEMPYGRWIVAAAGLTVLSVGVSNLLRAKRARVWLDLRFRDLSLWAQKGIVALGRAGEVTRGVIFTVMGGFVLQAAFRYDPQVIQGWKGTLVSLERVPFGEGLLFFTAAGLVSFGLFLILSSRYQRL